MLQGLLRPLVSSVWATGPNQSRLARIGIFSSNCWIIISLLAVLLWLGNAFFYRGYLSEQEIQHQARAISAEDMEKRASKTTSPVMALFKREWKLFMRTPIYLMNGIAGMIMVPFLMLMPFITQSEEMAEVVSLAKDPNYAPIAALVSLGIMLFASSMNLIASTSISREGRTFWISKLIPVSPKDQVLAKLIHSSCLSLIALIIIALPLYFLLDMLLYRLIVIIFIGFLANVLINILGLIIDLIRPMSGMLQEAIKQNLNAFLAMLVIMLFMLILGGIIVLLMLKGISELWIYGILSLIIVLLSVPSYYGLLTLANKKYNSLDV